jgi:hypothetical protein
MTQQNLANNVQTRELAHTVAHTVRRNAAASAPNMPNEPGARQNERKGTGLEPPFTERTHHANAKRYDKRMTSIYHEDLINSWTAFDSGIEYDPHDDDHVQARTATDNKGQNIIQSLILMLQYRRRQGDSGTLPAAAKPHLQQLILERPDMLPVLDAAKSQPDILFLAFDLVLPESTQRALEAHPGVPELCESCPLLDIPEVIRNGCPKTRHVESLSSAGDPPTAAVYAASNADPACLHDQIDTEMVLQRGKSLREKLQKLLEPVAQTRKVLESLLDATRLDPGPEDAQLIRPASLWSLLVLSPDDTFTEAQVNEPNLLGRAVNLFEEASIEYELLFEVIEALVRRSPASVFYNNGPKTNAYHLLAKLMESKSNTTMAREPMSKALDLIKRECIGYKGVVHGVKDATEMWAKKREVLYWSPSAGKHVAQLVLREDLRYLRWHNP